MAASLAARAQVKEAGAYSTLHHCRSTATAGHEAVI